MYTKSQSVSNSIIYPKINEYVCNGPAALGKADDYPNLSLLTYDLNRIISALTEESREVGFKHLSKIDSEDLRISYLPHTYNELFGHQYYVYYVDSSGILKELLSIAEDMKNGNDGKLIKLFDCSQNLLEMILKSYINAVCKVDVEPVVEFVGYGPYKIGLKIFSSKF